MDLENNSMKNQHSDLLFGTSNKGKPIIIYKNYFFKCNKTTESKKYWVCNEKACGVYVHTNINGEFICIKGDHNHSSNPDEVTVKLLRDKMKERILAETTSITKICDEEIVKANISKGATALIPTVVEFRSNMSKARRKKTPIFSIKRGQDRILIFASDQQLKLLYESSTIFMDGTFDIAPAPFKQVYLIHAENFGQGLPVAFCLLPNKRGRTYLELFERLKEQAILLKTKFDPKRIITDFEPGLLPVIQQELTIFPFAIHYGCMFHFNQAVHRKITDLGLASDYLHNEAIRNQCRQIMALSFMPIEQVHSQFQRLETITSAALSDLLLYFKNQ
ncbi:unnamed protein product [Rotaria magnacalcarata]|uniref:MULE transposase domain-containing protein n=1 Tax=Rotaria magnacalcarata TaxID=392030 RepID=A0A816L5H1_9BILA|nr:unnamed protein product [Rotaria magnacalcarata]